MTFLLKIPCAFIRIVRIQDKIKTSAVDFMILYASRKIINSPSLF